jgi:hypothetical protein
MRLVLPDARNTTGKNGRLPADNLAIAARNHWVAIQHIPFGKGVAHLLAEVGIVQSGQETVGFSDCHAWVGPSGRVGRTGSHLCFNCSIYQLQKRYRKKAWAGGSNERNRPTRSLPEHPIEDIDHNDNLVLAFGAFATGILGLADSGIINNWNDGNGG